MVLEPLKTVCVKVGCVVSDVGLNFDLNVRTAVLVSCLYTIEALIGFKNKGLLLGS